MPDPLPLFPIPRPCTADVDAMPGDDRLRRCAACGRDVHLVASLTAAEARALLERARTERVCVAVPPDRVLVERGRAAERRPGWGRRWLRPLAACLAALGLAGCGPEARDAPAHAPVDPQATPGPDRWVLGEAAAVAGGIGVTPAVRGRIGRAVVSEGP